MKKISIGATIAHGYRFGFGGFVGLFRLLWLPTAIAAVCNYFTGDQMSLFIRSLRTHDFSALSMPWPILLLGTTAAFVCSTMELTAAFQLALGQIEPANRWFYFPLLQKALWRVVGAMLLLMLTLAALVVVYLLAVLLIGFLFRLGFQAAHMSDAAINTVSTLDIALALLVGYCGFIFCAVRFGYLLFPATISEGKIGLFNAWSLSEKNFWRMLLSSVAVTLPILALEILFLAMTGIFRFPPPGATPAQIQAIQNTVAATADARMHHYWYMFYPLQGLVMILTYGTLAGAQSFAWRTLSENNVTPNPL